VIRTVLVMVILLWNELVLQLITRQPCLTA